MKTLIILVLALCGFNVFAQTGLDKKNYHNKNFKTEYKDTVGTYIQIFLIDGKRKFIDIKPKIFLFKSGEKTPFEFFLRDLNNNIPTIRPIKGNGLIDIVTSSNLDYKIENVEIKKNAINKIFIIENFGIMNFTYSINRNRNVMQNAVVKNLNDKMEHNCSCIENLTLISGKYYVSIDILPKYQLITEISPGCITEIQIPQEGAIDLSQLYFENAIELYFNNGNEYEKFMSIYSNDKQKNERIILRPGVYQLKLLNAEGEYTNELMVRVNPNIVTEITNTNVLSEEMIFPNNIFETFVYQEPVQKLNKEKMNESNYIYLTTEYFGALNFSLQKSEDSIQIFKVVQGLQLLVETVFLSNNNLNKQIELAPGLYIAKIKGESNDNIVELKFIIKEGLVTYFPFQLEEYNKIFEPFNWDIYVRKVKN